MAERVSLQRAKGVTVQEAGDGKHTALCFRTQAGITGAVVPDRDLSRLAALLINRSREIAGKMTPAAPAKQFTATPIMASHVVFGRGRSNREAMVTFQVGNMSLTFAVEASMLRDECTRLIAETKAGAKPAKAN